MRFVSSRLPSGTGTPAASRTPRPPTPTARCRTGSRRLSPRRPVRGPQWSACGRDEVVWNVAAGWTARSSSGCSRRSWRRTESVGEHHFHRLAPATTCRLVRMVPLSTMTTPLRRPSRRRRSSSLPRCPRATHAHTEGRTISYALAAADGNCLVSSVCSTAASMSRWGDGAGASASSRPAETRGARRRARRRSSTAVGHSAVRNRDHQRARR